MTEETCAGYCDSKVGRVVLRKKVVNVGPGNTHVSEFADRSIAHENHAAIDIRRIVCAARNAGLIEKNPKCRPVLRGSELRCDPLLKFHRLAMPTVFDLCRKLPRHPGGTRALLLRIDKNSETLEAHRLDEIQQRGKVSLRFARESNDKRCADCEPGNSRPKASDQIFIVPARSPCA